MSMYFVDNDKTLRKAARYIGRITNSQFHVREDESRTLACDAVSSTWDMGACITILPWRPFVSPYLSQFERAYSLEASRSEPRPDKVPLVAIFTIHRPALEAALRGRSMWKVILAAAGEAVRPLVSWAVLSRILDRIPEAARIDEAGAPIDDGTWERLESALVGPECRYLNHFRYVSPGGQALLIQDGSVSGGIERPIILRVEDGSEDSIEVSIKLTMKLLIKDTLRASVAFNVA